MSVIHGTYTYINSTTNPSLDLRFSYRKDLVDTISGKNLIDFSRSSIGTYVDADGVIKTASANQPRFDHDPTTGESLGLLVEESRTNIDKNSSLLSQWTVTELTKQPNATVAPDGTITATEYAISTTNADHYIIRYTGINYGDSISLTNYSTSFFVKPNGHTKFVILFVGGGGNNWESRAAYDLSTNTTGPVAVGRYIFGNPSGTVEVLNNGWYRIVHTFNRSSNIYGGFYVLTPYDTLPANFASSAITSGSYDFAGDGTSGFYLWGSQIEVGTFATSYIPTPATFTSRSTTATYYDANGTIQTAGINVARDNAYFPDENGVMRPAGLLLETAGTNLHTYSEQFDNVAWPKSNASITADTATAPDGTSTADKLIASATNSTHFIYQPSVAVPAGTATSSVYVKAAGLTEVNLYIYDGSAYKGCLFNLSTGATTPDSGVSPKIEQLANGWYRISVNYVSTGGLNTIHFFLVSNGVSTFLGDGVSGIYLWGAQVEASSYPTSYIPTTSSTVTRAADVSSSSTVTRAADVAQITGTNFSSWYNQSEGTLLMDQRNDRVDTDGYFFEIGGTSGNYAYAHSAHFVSSISGTSLQSRSYSSNSGSPPSSLFYASKPSPGKIVYAYKQGDYALGANGTLSTTSQSSWNQLVPTVDNYLGLNIRRDNTRSNVALTISRLTYYPQRLQDSTLQKLTK